MVDPHPSVCVSFIVGKLMEMHGDGAGGTRVDRGYEPPVQEEV